MYSLEVIKAMNERAEEKERRDEEEDINREIVILFARKRRLHSSTRYACETIAAR